MIRVDGVEHSYEKAINVFNFDKLGHPDGSGSWGIFFSIEDNFTDTMHIYIGLKFDVVSVFSSRFISTWFNMRSEHKGLIGAIRQMSDMDFSQQDMSAYDISTADSNHFYEFYIDIHKVEIDVVELARTIYQKPIHIQEYSFLVRHKAFSIKTERSARAISAKMMRTYEGNMETFSYIFTDSDRIHVINGLILSELLIADEIKYTVWLTPHDLEEGLFYETGDIEYEVGDEYIEGLKGGHVLSDVMMPLFTADRRGLRNGYSDVSAENPIVNHGYNSFGAAMFDTYMWGENGIYIPHRHISLVSIDSSFYNGCPKRLSSLSVNPGFLTTELIKGIQNDIIKTMIIKKFIGKGGERIGKINSLIQDYFVDSVLDAKGDPLKVGKAGVYIQQCKDYLVNTLVIPLSIHNILIDMTDLNTSDIQESIVIIHHPVLNKDIFFDVKIDDIVELNSSTFIFRVDGLEYGYSISEGHGEFYWAGIRKPFRYNDNIWINLKGAVYKKDVIPFVPSPIAYSEELAILTDSKVSVFEDLEYNGGYGTIIAVRKNDFIDIIKKKVGVVSSDQVFGIPGGNINISRASIWM